MPHLRGVCLLPVLATGLVVPASAHAALPGANGAIALGAGNRIILLDAARGHSRVLVRRPERDIGGLAWSASGRRLAFDTGRPDRDRVVPSEVRIVGPGGGPARRLGVTVDARRPSWAPNGRLAFTETVAGVEYIDTVASDGTGLTRLGPGRGPAWSPDGRWIAFTRASADGCGELVVSRAEGTGERVVARGRVVRDAHGGSECTAPDSPDFAPEGRRLLFRAAGRVNPDLRILDLDTLGSTRVLRDPRVRELPGAVFSPDGRRIAFAAEGPGRRRDGTFTVDVDGGHLRRLTHDVFDALAWQPLTDRRAQRDRVAVAEG
jgi:Tol biopolymer transport system component